MKAIGHVGAYVEMREILSVDFSIFNIIIVISSCSSLLIHSLPNYLIIILFLFFFFFFLGLLKNSNSFVV